VTVTIVAFYLEDMDNYHREHKIFSSNYIPHNRVENILEIVSVFLLFVNTGLVKLLWKSIIKQKNL
jgi:hypothetical protein